MSSYKSSSPQQQRLSSPRRRHYRKSRQSSKSPRSQQSSRSSKRSSRSSHSSHSLEHSSHHSGDDRSAPRRKNAVPNVILCFRCGELGHDVDQCLRFKVKLCKYFMDGWCERDDEKVPCPFAHGEAELRRPWVKKCVRVWSELKGDACIGGCGKLGHTYTECPLNRDSTYE